MLIGHRVLVSSGKGILSQFPHIDFYFEFTLPPISGLTTPGAWFPRVNARYCSIVRKPRLSKRIKKCYVCEETDRYAREFKMRKSGSDDVIVVNGEITDLVAHVHLNDDNFVA
ncbi:hypothetical protein Tco_0602958 [Tanacetum coccineum]